MGELRKDYILDRYVIIATDRAKRPDEFKSEKKAPDDKLCYFCPGAEKSTPPEISRFPDSEKWQIRVFPNKFPAVTLQGSPVLVTDNLFYTYTSSYGNHEVIVETPNHIEELSDLKEGMIAEVFRTFRERIRINLLDPSIKYVAAFKNHGDKAGTSIRHTHCQLISTNIIPDAILAKEKAVSKFESCPYCSIIKSEKDSFRRCFENSSFIAFTPYASRYPFEMMIMPKRHIVSMDQLQNGEFNDLAAIMKRTLMKLKELNADYNFYIQYGIEKMHLHIEVCPRINTWAGFELATGTIINVMSPEKAAEFYRS